MIPILVIEMITGRLYFGLALSISFSFQFLKAQITSAGLDGNTASWVALGLDNRLNSNWSTSSQMGYGRHSALYTNDYNPIKSNGIFTIRQILAYEYKNLITAYGIGYWSKENYSETTTYHSAKSLNEYRNELRNFWQVGMARNFNALSIKGVFRPELRLFYNQDFSNKWSNPFEFRLRFLTSVKYKLPGIRNNYLIAINEVFTAKDRIIIVTTTGSDTKEWSVYYLSEDRFSLIFRHSLNNSKIDLDLGMMNRFWRNGPSASNMNITSVFMMDLIFHLGKV